MQPMHLGASSHGWFGAPGKLADPQRFGSALRLNVHFNRGDLGVLQLPLTAPARTGHFRCRGSGLRILHPLPNARVRIRDRVKFHRVAAREARRVAGFLGLRCYSGCSAFACFRTRLAFVVDNADDLTSSLLQRARATPFVQSAIAAFGAETDQHTALAALKTARQDLDEPAVTTLLCALAAAGRLPPAAEFVPALALVADLGQFLGLLAMSPDDPSSALLDLCETGNLSRQRECVALLVVAVRHRRHGSGAPVDARICRLLRKQMRNPGSIEEALILAEAGEQLGDAEVAAVGRTLDLPRPSAMMTRRLLEMLDLGWRDFVPERAAPRVQVGTVRRQAPKVQRNVRAHAVAGASSRSAVRARPMPMRCWLSSRPLTRSTTRPCDRPNLRGWIRSRSTCAG